MWSFAGRLLSDHRAAAVLFNRGEETVEMILNFSSLGLDDRIAHGYSSSDRYQVRDVIGQHDLGEASGQWKANVSRHGVAFVVLTPVTPVREKDIFIAP